MRPTGPRSSRSEVISVRTVSPSRAPFIADGGIKISVPSSVLTNPNPPAAVERVPLTDRRTRFRCFSFLCMRRVLLPIVTISHLLEKYFSTLCIFQIGFGKTVLQNQGFSASDHENDPFHRQMEETGEDISIHLQLSGIEIPIELRIVRRIALIIHQLDADRAPRLVPGNDNAVKHPADEFSVHPHREVLFPPNLHPCSIGGPPQQSRAGRRKSMAEQCGN